MRFLHPLPAFCRFPDVVRATLGAVGGLAGHWYEQLGRRISVWLAANRGHAGVPAEWAGWVPVTVDRLQLDPLAR
jgi:hypothetical protein